MTEAVPVRSVNFREHPQRRILAGEVHARPYEILTAPVRATRLAVVTADATFACVMRKTTHLGA